MTMLKEATPPLKNVSGQRCSNIELLRIAAMLMIILHHYCVNSGLQDMIDVNHLTVNAILIQLMAVGGKIGVNIFFLISGYFVINSSFKSEHVVRLVMQVLFYEFLVTIFLHALGYRFTPKEYLGLIPFVFGVNDFVPCYLLVYMLSPIINKMLKTLSQKEFKFLLGVFLFYFMIEQTFMLQATWNYFSWALTMYMTGAYIRLYGVKVPKVGFGPLTALSFLFIWSCVLLIDLLHKEGDMINWRFFLWDANKLTVFLPALLMFLWFLNMKLKPSSIINQLAACSFGVFLIHTMNNTERQWLWGDLFNNVGQFDSALLVVHAFFAICSIYLVGFCVDLGRKQFVEKRMMKKLKLRPKFLW